MNQTQKNRYFFGLGTIGRDMFYAFKTSALLYFLSNVLALPLKTFAAAGLVLSLLRVVSAVMDPVIGMIVDNIRSPWGKFKPAIVIGGVTSVGLYLLIFSDVGTGTAYVFIFAVANVLWDFCYGLNDIAYWTLLPALTIDQQQRERNGAFARLCGNFGCHTALIFWEPVTAGLGNTPLAWFCVAIFISIVFLGGLCFPLFGVKEQSFSHIVQERTTIKGMLKALVANDQLMWLALMMVLNAIGYFITLGFSAYYMQYLYGDKSMYAVLSAVGAVGQIASLAIFPFFSRFSRRKIFTAVIGLNMLGYLVFVFAEKSLALILIAAMMLYFGQAIIQLIIVLFMADTIEYGQWKLGKRNESVTFSVQTMVNKVAGALSIGLISVAVVLAGIKSSDVAAESIDGGGKLVVKVTMCVIPFMLLGLSYFIYRKKYKIDKRFYHRILDDLRSDGRLEES